VHRSPPELFRGLRRRMQTEHKWKLDGIEAAAADTLKARLRAPPRLR